MVELHVQRLHGGVFPRAGEANQQNKLGLTPGTGENPLGRSTSLHPSSITSPDDAAQDWEVGQTATSGRPATYNLLVAV